MSTALVHRNNSNSHNFCDRRNHHPHHPHQHQTRHHQHASSGTGTGTTTSDNQHQHQAYRTPSSSSFKPSSHHQHHNQNGHHHHQSRAPPAPLVRKNALNPLVGGHPLQNGHRRPVLVDGPRPPNGVPSNGPTINGNNHHPILRQSQSHHNQPSMSRAHLKTVSHSISVGSAPSSVTDRNGRNAVDHRTTSYSSSYSSSWSSSSSTTSNSSNCSNSVSPTSGCPPDHPDHHGHNKKLDRALSEPVCDNKNAHHRVVSLSMSCSPSKGTATSAATATQVATQGPSLTSGNGNSSRYKTELCRPFEESGTCKYGEKCQFAHGEGELRSLQRHPKYKTELCRTFHTTGFCPYGPRCHFIHNSEENKKTVINSLQAGFGSSSTGSGSSSSSSSMTSSSPTSATTGVAASESIQPNLSSPFPSLHLLLLEALNLCETVD